MAKLYDSTDAPIAGGQTFYVGLPVVNGAIGAQVTWPDATSAATLTLQLSSNPGTPGAGAAADFTDAASFVGPVGAAAGATLINVDNVRQKFARLKVVTSATTKLVVWDGLQ